ncbi:hypothetical protein SAMN04487905_104127 [Actinopolyspora xinjiangensis]|uniref:Uncharacterized protein n=1 Tax=Actinopolyspora xinjiangensis TaxID=405564 RepID=A0A1H0SRF4_9ACTN|nr:hypothetical protein SAMN04487905_104127 [Actinopolyspora xinjiangensis]
MLTRRADRRWPLRLSRWLPRRLWPLWRGGRVGGVRVLVRTAHAAVDRVATAVRSRVVWLRRKWWCARSRGRCRVSAAGLGRRLLGAGLDSGRGERVADPVRVALDPDHER